MQIWKPRFLIAILVLSFSCKPHNKEEKAQAQESCTNSTCSRIYLAPFSPLYLYQGPPLLARSGLGLVEQTQTQTHHTNLSQGQIAGITIGATAAIGAIITGAILTRKGGASRASSSSLSAPPHINPPPQKYPPPIPHPSSHVNPPVRDPLPVKHNTSPSPSMGHASDFTYDAIAPSVRTPTDVIHLDALKPSDIRQLGTHSYQVPAEKVFGSHATGTLEIRPVYNLSDADFPANSWGEKHFNFERHTFFPDDFYLQQALTHQYPLPYVYTRSPYQYTILSVTEGHLHVSVTKGLSYYAAWAHWVMPSFIPKKVLGGGINEGMLFEGSLHGQSAVGKVVGAQELYVIHDLHYRSNGGGNPPFFMPVRASAVPPPNMMSGNGVIVVDLAKRDAKSASEQPDFDFYHFAENATYAVDQMHKLGYVHQDLKFENFLERQDGRFVITDFETTQQKGTSMTLMSDGKYQDPERFQNILGKGSHLVNPESDVFALGIMFGEFFLKRKNVDLHPPNFSNMKAEHTRPKYYQDSKIFQSEVFVALQSLARSGDREAAFYLRMISPLDRTTAGTFGHMPTISEVHHAMKNKAF